MHKRMLAYMLGVFFVMVSAHRERVVIDDNDDLNADNGQVIEAREIVDDDNSMFESVDQPLVRREFFDLNELLQRRQTSGFTAVQNQFQKQMLDAHNQYRTRHCVSSLRLDDSISRSAQNYAQHLADINQMVHSGTNGLGENLYMKWSSAGIKTMNGAEATDAWYNEIKLYNFNRPGFSMDTGHFTQVVWKGSQKLGAGFAITRDGKSVYVVAQYSPPGNYMGQFEQNVLAARC